MAAVTFISASAYKYSYSFNNTPVSEAIAKISKAHPDVNISFIYKELDNYKTYAQIHIDNAYDTLRNIIGINPVSVIKKSNHYSDRLWEVWDYSLTTSYCCEVRYTPFYIKIKKSSGIGVCIAII